MKNICQIFIVIAAIAWPCVANAQRHESTNTGVQRRPTTAESRDAYAPQVASRPNGGQSASLSEGDIQWMKIVYRELDLDKEANATLRYPEEMIDGRENLLRVVMRLLADGTLAAYEYLDGREVFAEKYSIDLKDVLDRFDIPYAAGRKPHEYVIDEADVPVGEVMAYYIIERWEFDNRNSRVRTEVEAICPVLHRVGDFGGEPLKYPMFWIRYSDLRAHLMSQPIFVDDDNNMPAPTYADYFALNMYDGEIYKTRNLRNKSMEQLYPDPDDMKRAQDSIQHRLETFEDKLWVPDREEVIAERQARDSISASEAEKQKKKASRISGRKSSAKRSTKLKSDGTAQGNVTRSVRRKK